MRRRLRRLAFSAAAMKVGSPTAMRMREGRNAFDADANANAATMVAASDVAILCVMDMVHGSWWMRTWLVAGASSSTRQYGGKKSAIEIVTSIWREEIGY